MVMRAELVMEFTVTFQPPEGRPADDNVSSPAELHSFQLAQRRLVVGRRTPPESVFLEKGQDASLAQHVAPAPLLLIHKEKCALGWNCRKDILFSLVQVLPPPFWT